MKRYKKTLAVFFCFLIVLSLTLSGCGKKISESMGKAEESTSILSVDPENLDDITMEGLVSEILGQMTLEQKIGQLFIVSTDSLDFNAETNMTDKMKENIKKYQPGGVIFFSYNFTNLDNEKKNRNKIKTRIRIKESTRWIRLEQGGLSGAF